MCIGDACAVERAHAAHARRREVKQISSYPRSLILHFNQFNQFLLSHSITFMKKGEIKCTFFLLYYQFICSLIVSIILEDVQTNLNPSRKGDQSLITRPENFFITVRKRKFRFPKMRVKEGREENEEMSEE